MPSHLVGAITKGSNREMAAPGFSYSEASDPVKPNGTQRTDCNFFQYMKRYKSVKDEALEADCISIFYV